MSLVREKREDEATFVETMLETGFVLELLISRILCIFMFFLFHSNAWTPSLRMI
jgi:hypothetical protein